jgi:hypothetical protein
VVNLLYVEVPSPEPQIWLKARFASVDRNVEKQLELNVFTLGVANSIGSGTTQQFSPLVIFALSSLRCSPQAHTPAFLTCPPDCVQRVSLPVGAVYGR